MKIVHLCRRFYPDQGGVETHVLKVAEELIKRGHEQSVITLLNESDKNHSKINVIRIVVPSKGSAFKYKLAVWRGIWKNFHLLKQADRIQVHDVFWWLLPFLPLLGGKVYTTFHGYEPPGPPTSVQKFWHRLAALLSKKTLGIGSIHERWYGVKTDAISFGAVDPILFGKSGVRKDRKGRAMYLGRVSGDIGVMQYLEALRIQPIPLDVYGEGELLEKAKQFVRQHALPVRFMGGVANAARLIGRYDLVLASSYLAILEALSVGKPVVAFYGSPLKQDYLLETPFARWISAASTPRAIAAMLQRRLQNPPKAAAIWARGQTWEKLADVYERLWA